MDNIDAKILNLLAKQLQPITEAVLLKAIKGRRSSKVLALRSLVESEKILRSGDGKRGCPFRYSSRNFGQLCKHDEDLPSLSGENDDDLQEVVALFSLLLRLKRANSTP